MKSRLLLATLIGLIVLLACGLSDLGGIDRTDCEQDLSKETIDRLTLSLGVLDGAKQIQPGQTYDYEVGVTECCYTFEEVPACVTWSITPEDGAEIDPNTGVVRIDANTPGGRVFTVQADVQYNGGRRVLTDSLAIYTTESNPLVGLWTEVAQYTCESAFELELTPEQVIGELQFTADGDFSVTWYPFEIYRDYWGTYTFDLESGVLELTVLGGNYVPEGIDSSGFFQLDESGRLQLIDIWLGSPQNAPLAMRCGHIFK